MKKLLLIALLLAAPLCMDAQDKASLEQNAQKMMDFTVSKDFSALLDLTYPKLFEIVPREQMMQALSGMMNGDDIKVELLPTPPNFKFGDIKKIENGTYCLVEHDLAMKMIYADTTIDPDMMISIFKEGLDTEDVTYDKAQNAYIIKKRAQIIAVADAATGGKWTFVNNDGGKLIPMIFPDNVRKELGL